MPGLQKYHGQDINLTEALTREALDEMDRAVKAEKPFYLYLSHYAVHAPWEKDKRFYQKYKEQGLTDFEAILASMIESMDKSLGDILTKVQKLGIEDNTIIIFMSDNGSPSQCPQNLPLRSHKVSPYEGGIRVPMIVKWADVVQAGSSCNKPLIIEDIFPSILEMASVEKPEQTVADVDGRSFVPLLKQEDVNASEREFVWHFPHNYDFEPYSVIRKGDWKLIYWYKDGRTELYNIPQDIGETKDLSAEQPEITLTLTHQLGEYLKSVHATAPYNKITQTNFSFPD
ncbi:MAG: sulfatase-like hydrolase/transferase [Bacteroidales bacterium]